MGAREVKCEVEGTVENSAMREVRQSSSSSSGDESSSEVNDEACSAQLVVADANSELNFILTSRRSTVHTATAHPRNGIEERLVGLRESGFAAGQGSIPVRSNTRARVRKTRKDPDRNRQAASDQQCYSVPGTAHFLLVY